MLATNLQKHYVAHFNLMNMVLKCKIHIICQGETSKCFMTFLLHRHTFLKLKMDLPFPILSKGPSLPVSCVGSDSWSLHWVSCWPSTQPSPSGPSWGAYRLPDPPPPRSRRLGLTGRGRPGMPGRWHHPRWSEAPSACCSDSVRNNQTIQKRCFKGIV